MPLPSQTGTGVVGEEREGHVPRRVEGRVRLGHGRLVMHIRAQGNRRAQRDHRLVSVVVQLGRRRRGGRVDVERLTRAGRGGEVRVTLVGRPEAVVAGRQGTRCLRGMRHTAGEGNRALARAQTGTGVVGEEREGHVPGRVEGRVRLGHGRLVMHIRAQGNRQLNGITVSSALLCSSVAVVEAAVLTWNGSHALVEAVKFASPL